MRQADGGRTRGVLRLVVAQPAQLGDRERRDRHQPDRVHPRRRAAELVDQVEGGLRGAGVVPQQRRAYDGAGLVEADHAVLLAADRDRRDVVEPAGGRDRLLERVPPGVGVHLGALGMGGGPAADQRTGVRVADDDLAGLGRGVDPGDERHAADCVRVRACATRPDRTWSSATPPTGPRSSPSVPRLRSLTHTDRRTRDLVAGWPAGEMNPQYRGWIMMPFPNRIADGALGARRHDAPAAADRAGARPRAARPDRLGRSGRSPTTTRPARRCATSCRRRPATRSRSTSPPTTCSATTGCGSPSPRPTPASAPAPYGTGHHPYVTLGRQVDDLVLTMPADDLLRDGRALPARGPAAGRRHGVRLPRAAPDRRPGARPPVRRAHRQRW